MTAPAIQIGDEVKLRKVRNTPVAVVTYNEADEFCAIDKNGRTYNMSRAAAYPLKTGRHFESTLDFLDSIR